MPVRIADSMKQQNDLDTFPVAYGADIWLDKNKGEDPANYKSLQAMYNDDELGGGGSSIQVETMPAASDENVGKIVQYVGESGTYQKGHFYECILAHNGAGSIYAWEDVDHLRFNHVVYHCTVPPVNEECKPGDIIYYSGKTMGNFKNGYYYRAIPNATPQQHYGATFWTTPSLGTGYLCYTPFELRIGFIVYPTGTGGTSYPYEIKDFDDTGITITPYGWSGEDRHYVGVSYTKTVEGWEELGSGGSSIFYGTMDEWNELTTDAKKQYDYMADNDAGGNYIDTYSTSEVKTNKVWIDGKPIYRRVYKCTTATSLAAGESWKNIPGWDVDVSRIATITYLFGSVYYWGRIDWNKGTNNKLLWCSLNSTITVPVDAALTIEYTKTTD